MQLSTFQLILHAGFFVKIILAFLAGFSFFSWVIIVYKYLSLRRADEQSAALLAAVASGATLKDLLDTAHTLSGSPLAALLIDASTQGHGHRGSTGASMRRSELREIETLQSYLTFLATIGSTAPFIGLLGTVWGIMNAFRGIGATGSASLAVVAPGIAEALITTAAGLAAAIPAVMAYNAYVNWVRRMNDEIEEFAEQIPELLGKRSA